MFRLLISIALLITYTWMYSWAQEPEKKEPNGLIIEQICNGFPGTKQKEKTKQKLVVKGDKIFMENLETPHLCIVRGDKKAIWEISKEDKAYIERPFSYFDNLKKDRETTRANAVKQLNAVPNPELRAKHAKRLGYPVGENGKVPDKIVAKTEVTGEKKVINGFQCERIKIYEDLRVVLDLWLTKRLKAPASLMKFYKRLGCFSDEVVAEMEKIKDFPVVLKAELDFGAVTLPIECEITKVDKKFIEGKRFELPKGLKLTGVIGKEPVKKQICPVTGKEVNPKAKATVRFVHKGVAYYFIDKASYLRFVKKLSELKDSEKVLKFFAEERAKAKQNK